MEEVQAVKDLDKVKLISYLLELRYSKQMVDVWNIGLNLALRISDLLSPDDADKNFVNLEIHSRCLLLSTV
ncbi:Integrase/recombinase, XerC/XerD family protein [Moritella viscosa]|uniref:Integrase/recombinase, XerC/XerD family protein n=1 Tax=Moritella viscosa TaxID=80854 RepID=A0A1L0ALJ5_9GAMM|nr:Integrase/recombinase, XerC/XerD family protein [Moritella viscosa]